MLQPPPTGDGSVIRLILARVGVRVIPTLALKGLWHMRTLVTYATALIVGMSAHQSTANRSVLFDQ